MSKNESKEGCTGMLLTSARATVLSAMCLLLASGEVSLAQGGSGASGSTRSSTGTQVSNGSSSGAREASGPSTVQAAQQALTSASGSTTPAGASTRTSDYRGSLIEGKSSGGVLGLSLPDAIQRGFRTNLGIILQNTDVQSANGSRLQQLQSLLPTVTGDVTYTREQVNLATFGLKIPGLNPIVGPFQFFDARAYLTQSLINVSSIQRYLASKHNFQGTKLTAEDARNLVVLTVGNAYLLCIADASRISAVEAQLANAKVSLDQATAAHDAGTSPKLDVLRAQVDYQNEQQQLIQARNNLAKDKLSLARSIGLPLDQEFRLTDTAPYREIAAMNPDTAFQQAVKARRDLAGQAEQLKGSEAQRKSAVAEQYPTLTANGDFGDIGTTFGHSHGTYTAIADLSAPILQIAKTRGDIEAADASLQQARARLSDQVQQVNADVRDAMLDIEAAAKLVSAARSNVDLAGEALSEAQQRFRAGVTDSLSVSDAQSQAQSAADQYISALYQHNVAKLSLARAMGSAGTNYNDALQLGGK